MLGRYELMERIAIGGTAEVFRGRVVGAAGFEKHVAIKRILPTFARDERFIRALVNEARIASSMSQANIVQMHDVGVTEDGQYFLVMEFVDGRDLRTVLERLAQHGRRLSPDLAMFIVGEIAEALDYVHRRTDAHGQPLRLVHRDVSPPNILVSRNGEVKLADFGIAKRAHEQSVVSTLKGKFAYMSPEQSRLQPLDHTTDLFSLGAVLYELICGRRAFQGASDLETLLLVREARFVPPAEVEPRMSSQLESIITRALSLRPRDRFRSAAEVGVALREVRFSQTEATSGAPELARLMRELFPAEPVRAQEAPRRDVITLSTMVRRGEPTTAPGRGQGSEGPPPTPAMRPLPRRPPAPATATPEDQNEFGGITTGDSVIVEMDHMLGQPKVRAQPPPVPARDRRDTPTAKFASVSKDLRMRRTASQQAPIPLQPRPRSSQLRTVIIATLCGALGAAIALVVFVTLGGTRARGGLAVRIALPPADAPRAPDASVHPDAPGDGPPRDAAPAAGHLALRSEPPGARVELDDAPTCTTPCERDVPPGRHRLRFSLSGRRAWSEVFELGAGERRRLEVRLPAEAPARQGPPRPKPKKRH